MLSRAIIRLVARVRHLPRTLPRAYQIDARRCISYVTIDPKGHIARESASDGIASMAARLPRGCPWNKSAQRRTAFHPRIELTLPLLKELAMPAMRRSANLRGWPLILSGAPVLEERADRSAIRANRSWRVSRGAAR